MKQSKTIDAFIEKHSEWKDELETLVSIFRKSELTETIKWGMPTYTLNGKNVAGLGAFKNYVAVWFHQGVFLKDPNRKLINAQEGKTKGMRQWRFQNKTEIDPHVLKAYINEAIENQKKGLEIKPDRKKSATSKIPTLLNDALQSHGLSKDFESLAPYKQKEFIEYIVEAKREATKLKRLDKILPMIKSGIGLSDKYRSK